MIKFFIFLLVIISIIISGVLSAPTPEAECNKQSNTDCQSCLNISGCAYCKTSKECFPVPTTGITDRCKTSDLQVVTCLADAQTLLIILGSVGGVLVIVIVIIVCCICRKCNRCQRLRDKKRQDLNERQMEDRRAAAEMRSIERNQKADQIRMKYGLMKGKDTSVEYKRMS